MQETGRSIIHRVSGALFTRKTVQGARARSAKLREELAEAESIEALIESMFTENMEMIAEIEQLTTKMRDVALARKTRLQALLSED